MMNAILLGIALTLFLWAAADRYSYAEGARVLESGKLESNLCCIVMYGSALVLTVILWGAIWWYIT